MSYCVLLLSVCVVCVCVCVCVCDSRNKRKYDLCWHLISVISMTMTWTRKPCHYTERVLLDVHVKNFYLPENGVPTCGRNMDFISLTQTPDCPLCHNNIQEMDIQSISSKLVTIRASNAASRFLVTLRLHKSMKQLLDMHQEGSCVLLWDTHVRIFAHPGAVTYFTKLVLLKCRNQPGISLLWV